VILALTSEIFEGLNIKTTYSIGPYLHADINISATNRLVRLVSFVAVIDRRRYVKYFPGIIGGNKNKLLHDFETV